MEVGSEVTEREVRKDVVYEYTKKKWPRGLEHNEALVCVGRYGVVTPSAGAEQSS